MALHHCLRNAHHFSTQPGYCCSSVFRWERMPHSAASGLLLLHLLCCRVIAAAQQPVRQKLKESSKFVRHYVAAQKASPMHHLSLCTCLASLPCVALPSMALMVAA